MLLTYPRQCIGNIFDKVQQLEAATRSMEEIYGENYSDTNKKNLYKTHAEYIHWLKVEESILKQKAIIKWAEKGDTNSKYLYSVIKQRIRRAQIQRIKNKEGHWIEGNSAISEEALRHFKHIFTEDEERDMGDILRWIDSIITKENNDLLQQTPSEEEVKNVVFSIDPNSAAGPDGFNGYFFSSHMGHHQNRRSTVPVFLVPKDPLLIP
ncbi:uncharacterized protein LOC142178193 [Nicotiana tabacum]|uniref:Uncharacterized protein LOC142178193 n=1 Tax=Nicotiana tabacum TaxID=4097 RepID=A0AC58U2C0_TOBAC